MSQWYTLFSFVTNPSHPTQDLSAFFQTPNVADAFRKNTSWRLIETHYPVTYWTGTVGDNGELSAGTAPGNFTFTSSYPYDGFMELQVSFDPEPTTQCGCSDNPSGVQSCPSGVTTGPGSVQLPSGRFVHNIPLLALSALGEGGWKMDLDYYPDLGLNSLLGKNFNFPQSAQLIDLESGGVANIELLTSQNTREMFTFIGFNQYGSTTNNAAAILVRGGTGINDEFTLSAADGTVSKFYGFDDLITTPGRLKSITDRHGNQQTYAWINTEGIDQLVTVTDSYGRSIEYRYYGEEADYRLREIEDFLGRKLNFQYDEFGHLVAAVTPSVMQAAPGNEFPGGTGYVFEYDVENVELARRDDLIKIWYPNEVAPYLVVATRTVNVDDVYANATPRYIIEYGQDPGDTQTWGKVIAETVGDPSADIGGTSTWGYTNTGLPSNLINPSDLIVSRCTMTDRNGNETVHDFNAAQMEVRSEVKRNRNKINVPDPVDFPSYVTWTKYNTSGRPLLIVYPEGSSVEYEYESGTVTGIGSYPRRNGLMLRMTRKPGNTLGLPARSGSNGQEELTQRYFYDPIFNRQCAMIEERGNPITASGTYFTPQNGGTTPTNADRSRYATVQYFDYQKNTDATIKNDPSLQALLFPGQTSSYAASNIQLLLDFVHSQMQSTGGSGGLPAGFPRNLGDINGDGTGDGNSSGLPAAPHSGNIIKIKHPAVRLIGVDSITTQVREELFTVNARGQNTTHTDPEGNLTVYVRYPGNDPEGDGQYIATGISGKQYGRLKEIHVDADPNDVLSLVGADGDLVDFISGKITRTNTPGVYQDLVTRYEGNRIGVGCGCAACAYDALGNPLAVTDPRGFTTNYDRNELGEVYRTISPTPPLAPARSWPTS